MSALFLRRFWPYLLALVAVLSVGVVATTWLHRHDARIRLEQQLMARDTIIKQRTDTAQERTRERRVDSGTIARILPKVQHDTRWKHDTIYVAGDTTPRFAVPIGTIVQHDSAFAACGRLNLSCAREHAADSVVIAELRQSLALARTGYAIPPPSMSWKERALWAGLGALAGHYTH